MCCRTVIVANLYQKTPFLQHLNCLTLSVVNQKYLETIFII